MPIAKTGGPGTREGHWRALIFGDELLTGFLSGINRPISRLSLGAFADIGYKVDYSAADPFELPSFRKLPRSASRGPSGFAICAGWGGLSLGFWVASARGAVRLWQTAGSAGRDFDRRGPFMAGKTRIVLSSDHAAIEQR
ncbi:MAG: leishmanolysin-related zinc metalloendopeptidase [Pseudomonadota bacterium]